MLSNDQLVQAAINGDESALNRLLNSWYKVIYNIAFKYFGDADSAVEITQKTFIKVYENISSLEQAKTFSSWIYRIAINYCHQENRKRKKMRLVSWFSFGQNSSYQNQHTPLLNNLNSGEAEVDASIIRTQTQKILQEALNHLKDEQREVVILKEYEALTFKEIAEILDISENTVKTRLYAALKQLRHYFEINQLEDEVRYGS